MFPNISKILDSASSYFYLPIEEDFDETDYRGTKHISWSSSSDTLDSDDSEENLSFDSSTISHTSSSPEYNASKSSSRPPKSRAVIKEVLAQEDLYKILGVSRNSRIDRLALRRAYLTRSKACHPDKFPGNPEATEAFQKVAVAYDVLSKPSSKRMYDSAPPSPYNFASHPYQHAEETFRSVVLGVFNDFLDGDLETVRTLLRAVNDLNPSLRLGDDGIDAVLLTLQSIRQRALTCRTCVLALNTELSRLLEVKHAFRQLSYFDLRRRSRLTIELARIAISLPIALDRALQRQKRADLREPEMTTTATTRGDDDDEDNVENRESQQVTTALLNKRVYGLLCSFAFVLERVESVL
ncbi:hypothetical protein C8Q75DRAFT_809950 [Abortiporus biennis]|nr:hypothetical protein C8Q75DRAFT_809950 [Abortiporus biennis]